MGSTTVVIGRMSPGANALCTSSNVIVTSLMIVVEKNVGDALDNRRYAMGTITVVIGRMRLGADALYPDRLNAIVTRQVMDAESQFGDA